MTRRPVQLDLERDYLEVPAFLLVENRPSHLREHAETSIRQRREKLREAPLLRHGVTRKNPKDYAD